MVSGDSTRPRAAPTCTRLAAARRAPPAARRPADHPSASLRDGPPARCSQENPQAARRRNRRLTLTRTRTLLAGEPQGVRA